MKKLLILIFIIMISFLGFSQTDGITYQAVIINPDALELPGVDSEGNYLPNETIAVRFTIFDSTNQVEFQEVQITDTDEFGRINLLIGDGDHDYFKEIEWDGTPKDLKVDIDFDAGNNFETMSRERLTFLPYAYHRNITATGTLTVDDRTFLNGELVVEGPTNLNSTLDVNNQNASNLSGSLTVGGQANLNDALNVNNGSTTSLTGELEVNGSAALDSDLVVLGTTTLNDLVVNGEANFGDLSAETLTVTDSTILRGSTLIDGEGSQIRITSDMPNFLNPLSFQTSTTYPVKASHPLLIDGGKNGLAITVDGSRNNDTNFITFYDANGNEPWGRIEGETEGEFINNADYNFDQTSLDFDIYSSEVDFGFAFANSLIASGQLIANSSDVRPCAGFGACVTAPSISQIAFAIAEVASAAIQVGFAGAVLINSNEHKQLYDSNKIILQGVTYASGAGDYAEYLRKKSINENMRYGDIVGLSGGKISKETQNAERMMVISYKPIVLGNMPEKNQEKNYEKVAFMGQVPVKVIGKVKIGDYIIPSGLNDGSGVAISPNKISSSLVNQIVGIAWSESNGFSKYNMVNVAVGLNRNDNNIILERLEQKITEQQIEINDLKTKINDIYEILSNSDYNSNDESDNSLGIETNKSSYDDRKYEILESESGDMIYWEITREDFERGLSLAKKQMIDNDIDIENHRGWIKVESDPKFKEELFTKIRTQLDKQLHYHKKMHKTGSH